MKSIEGSWAYLANGDTIVVFLQPLSMNMTDVFVSF